MHCDGSKFSFLFPLNEKMLRSKKVKVSKIVTPSELFNASDFA
jgi:hypothetical protein